MVDGAIGMAYGVISNSFLILYGVPPVNASAYLHASEIFTTGASGLSHLRLKNVDKSLLKKMIIPGVVGGALGAYVLTTLNSDILKLAVSMYLIGMGSFIIYRAIKEKISNDINMATKTIVPLCAVGGCLDAIGGGGWGPVVTSTMVAKGNDVKKTIGTVNLTEFFVTLSETFMFLILFVKIDIILVMSMLIGGVIAAPLAAYTCKKFPLKPLMVFIGALVIFLNVRNIFRFLEGPFLF
ncbi:MAG: sulfite exporter TauE/SafE family protein [Candidatus Helarchaeota archaeon]|nr:sulfite exporter TauE/SafE family protein [Candidatus Helarchaeota archaeon]NVM52745.1 sulfite exporter TauE/SafE family protein [Candidatus Helarchaeota archaeon]